MRIPACYPRPRSAIAGCGCSQTPIDGAGVAGVYLNPGNDPIVTLRSPRPTIQIVLEGRESMPAFAGQVPPGARGRHDLYRFR